MMLDKQGMIDIVHNQLAIDMNCSPQDFLEDGITFCEAALSEGRRMFERQSPYIEIATMGMGIVVSADAEILKWVEPLLKDKSRDDVFFAPFVYGHSLYYLPDAERNKRQPCPQGFTLDLKERDDIHALYELPGFYNAINYEANHPRPDVMALCAINGTVIAGMAGASADSATMWQIGIDVLPDYRGRGLAASLVGNLAAMIMERGIVPYYGTASSNIASQAVAYRSGLMPVWMCTYKNTLGTYRPYDAVKD